MRFAATVKSRNPSAIYILVVIIKAKESFQSLFYFLRNNEFFKLCAPQTFQLIAGATTVTLYLLSRASFESAYAAYNEGS